VTLDATAQAPWLVSVPASAAAARAHVILDNHCLLRTTGGETIDLKAGELVFLPHGDAHVIGSSLDGEPVTLASLMRVPIAGEFVPIRIGESGEASRWVALHSACERHLADPLLACLPSVVRVDMLGAPALNWLTASLGLNLSGSDAPPVGAAAKRDRLAELVIIEALRRHVDAEPAHAKGWIAGLNDRFVGRALAIVYGRPSEPWTVERLGRQVGLSRSALAERFSDVMGEPIIAFLTRWRLQLAAEALIATNAPIRGIATSAGYESPGAFAAAFKRKFRRTPSDWRRNSRKRR
jgi:AraC-like DNA-binding protein